MPDVFLPLQDRISVDISHPEGTVVDFTFNITKISYDYIEIALDFVDTSTLFQGGVYADLLLLLDFGDFEPALTLQVDKTMPKIVNLDADQAQAVQSVAVASKGATAASGLLSIFMSGILNQLYSLINGLQIITYLPLFKSANFPDLSFLVLQRVIEIADFDFFDT